MPSNFVFLYYALNGRINSLFENPLSSTEHYTALHYTKATSFYVSFSGAISSQRHPKKANWIVNRAKQRKLISATTTLKRGTKREIHWAKRRVVAVRDDDYCWRLFVHSWFLPLYHCTFQVGCFGIMPWYMYNFLFFVYVVIRLKKLPTQLHGSFNFNVFWSLDKCCVIIWHCALRQKLLRTMQLSRAWKYFKSMAVSVRLRLI